MKKVTTLAAAFCGIFILSSCDPQPKDSETVIIKENTTKEPIVVEENINDNAGQTEEEGFDIELGTNEEGEVDVNVKGRVRDDK